jgi:hypothetical protein
MSTEPLFAYGHSDVTPLGAALINVSDYDQNEHVEHAKRLLARDCSGILVLVVVLII